jgi:uncharacterized protein (TIGR02466 family)
MKVNLGEIPLGYFDYDSSKLDLIKQYCLSNEKPNTIESLINSTAKSNLWESTFNILDAQELSNLKIWLTTTSQEFVNQLNNIRPYKFVITESWAHVTRNHGYHLPHRHNHSTWSGIFYVSSGNYESGQNSIYNPYYIERKTGLDFMDDRFVVEFKPGRLVLFPSMLMHDAVPYVGEEPRIVIAFNAICV